MSTELASIFRKSIKVPIIYITVADFCVKWNFNSQEANELIEKVSVAINFKVIFLHENFVERKKCKSFLYHECMKNITINHKLQQIVNNHLEGRTCRLNCLECSFRGDPINWNRRYLIECDAALQLKEK